MREKKIDSIANSLRIKVLELARKAAVVGKPSHIGGALSACEILAYIGFIREPQLKTQDERLDLASRIILSKGHSAMALYALLLEMEIVNFEQFENYPMHKEFLGHPTRNTKLGISYSTGSLGNGFSLAVGKAIAGKIKKNERKIYVILGDGECNEGLVWEAAMAAVKYRCNNLMVFVDKNGHQQTGTNQDIMPSCNIKKLFSAIGFDTYETSASENLEKLAAKLTEDIFDRPRAVIVNTIKGSGVAAAEGNNQFHHSLITEEQYASSKKILLGLV